MRLTMRVSPVLGTFKVSARATFLDLFDQESSSVTYIDLCSDKLNFGSSMIEYSSSGGVNNSIVSSDADGVRQDHLHIYALSHFLRMAGARQIAITRP